jgi:hypothetical protein
LISWALPLHRARWESNLTLELTVELGKQTRTTTARSWIAAIALIAGLLTSFAASAATWSGLSISGTPPTTAAVGQIYGFQASARSAYNLRIRYSISNAPSWTTFDTSTGRLIGMPGVTGKFSNIVITASDGFSRTSLPAFSITVGGTTSTSLKLSGTPTPTVSTGTSYAFQPSASGTTRTVYFSIANRPSWATFSSSTGRLSGSTMSAGTFSNISISATDGVTRATLPAFSIQVTSGTTTNTAQSHGHADCGWHVLEHHHQCERRQGDCCAAGVRDHCGWQQHDD